MGSELEDGVVTCLEAMYLHVAKQLPDYIINHAGILGNYVRLPIPEDVVDAMTTMCKRKGNKSFEKLQSVSPDHKRQLRKLCSKMEESQMIAAHKRLLLNLPVFETAKLNEEDEVRFVSLTEVKRAAPLSMPAISIKETLVDLSEDSSRTLAKALGVFPMSTANLLAEVVFRDIISGKLDKSQIKLVMTYVLENLHVLNRESSHFGDQLKKVPFVANKSGLHRPTDLCDPESEVLQDMFFGDDVFPQAEYSEPAYLVLLRQLGLRTEDDLSAVDVYQCVCSIEEQYTRLQSEKDAHLMKKNDAVDQQSGSKSSNGDKRSTTSETGTCDIEEEKKISEYCNTLNRLVKKSTAVLRYLDRHPHRLEQTMHNGTLKQWLHSIPWVPTMQERLPMYPDSLKWLSGPAFACPSQLSSMEWFPMVASVTCLCKEPAGPEVSHALNWDQMPHVDTVITQLFEVVKSYDNSEKAKYLAIITSIYDYLAQQNVAMVQKALHDAKLTQWIWHGDGFISADKVTLFEKCYFRLYFNCYTDNILNTSCLFMLRSDLDTFST